MIDSFVNAFSAARNTVNVLATYTQGETSGHGDRNERLSGAAQFLLTRTRDEWQTNGQSMGVAGLTGQT